MGELVKGILPLAPPSKESLDCSASVVLGMVSGTEIIKSENIIFPREARRKKSLKFSERSSF